jgi:hypothetical protein
MTRLRALAALLSCLAVLAGGFAVVAATTGSRPLVSEHSAVDGQPCSHCDDCDGVPCPKPAAACLQASPTATPAITAAAIEPPAMSFATVHWSPLSSTLSGLSPPPDPFPPRT